MDSYIAAIKERKALTKELHDHRRTRSPEEEYTVKSEGLFITDKGYERRIYQRVTSEREEVLRNQIMFLKTSMNVVYGSGISH